MSAPAPYRFAAVRLTRRLGRSANRAAVPIRVHALALGGVP